LDMHCRLPDHYRFGDEFAALIDRSF